MSGKKICFIGRGGSGKSTCLVLLAQALQEQGRQVCLLDADSTNVGLHAALGMEAVPSPLVQHFGGMVFQGGSITCPVDDPSLIENAELDLNELPSRFQVRNTLGITFLQTGKLVDFGLGAGCDGPMVKLARDLRVHRGGQPVDLLVDFKAGLEDTSRGAVVGMDTIVVVCDPSMAGIEAAVSMHGIMEAQRIGGEPSTAHLESPALVALMKQLYHDWRTSRMVVVLNRVPDTETEDYLRQQLSDAGIEVSASVPQLTVLRDAWLKGLPLPNMGEANPLRHLAEGL